MKINLIIIIAIIFISACSKDITVAEIKSNHNIRDHVNSSVKLMQAEGDLLRISPHSFVAYQKMRRDPRSYIVSNLSQSGRDKNYLTGNGFYLIDEDHLATSSFSDLAKTLHKATQKKEVENRYSIN